MLKGTENTPGQSQMAEAMSAARSNASQQQQRTAGQPSSANPERNTFSWRRLGSLIPAPMGRTPQSEVLTRLQKSIEEVYKNNTNPTYELTVLPIDYNQDLSLALSVLVIAARDVTNPKIGLAYHTLLLEGSVDPFPPRFEQIGGQNVEILRTASDANDDKLQSIVREYLRRQFPQVNPAAIYYADAEVVPRGFELEDDLAVFQLAANCAYAVTHDIEQRRDTFQDVNLADASREDSLVVRIAVPRTQVTNAVNMPVRQDVSIDLTAVAANQPQQQQSLERQAVVARAGGFVDLVWDPEMPSQNPYAVYNQPQQQNFHRYAARLVLTTLESVAASTIPAQLIALVTAMAFGENNQWVEAFRPQPFQAEGVDLHDIGAIGIELNFDNNANGIGSRIDTKSESFKRDSLGKLVAATIKPGLVYSLDVDECGPSTWYNGVFAAEANGSSSANQAIIRAATYLTNGAFSRHFLGGRICTDEFNVVHTGYYTDRHGNKRDIREIDYLAVLNLVGEKDPEVLRDWSDSFNRVDFPLAQRLAGRKRILQALIPDVVFTGFARRVTFDSNFLKALAAACLECNLDIRSSTPYTDLGSYERAGAAFVNNAIMAPAASGLFNRAYGSFASPGGQWQNRAFHSRW